MNKILALLLFTTSFSALAEGAIGYDPKTATTASSTALNDAQYKVSQEYVHEGLVQRKLNEACQGKESECSGREVDSKFMGLSSNMVKMVAKAYGMVIGAIGMTQEQKDYCSLIPAGTELIATFQQQTQQSNLKDLPTNQATAQKDSLYKAARSHEARADGSKIQFMGYAAATACYPAQMSMTGGYDWASAAKMGASGFLAFFYKSEMDRYKKAAEFTKKVADELPGKGDCNPITQKDCYCLQPESKNYAEYTQICVPAALQRQKTAQGQTPVSCLNASRQLDTSCECLKTNNCYDKTFASEIQGLSARNAMASAYSGVADLAKGNLSEATLGSVTAGYQNAMGKLREIDNRVGDEKGSYNADDAKALGLSGMGPNMARKLAAIAPGAGFESNLAKIKANYSGNMTIPSTSKSSGADTHILEFGGQGSGKNKKTGTNLDLSKFMPGQKKSTTPSGEVLTYPSDSTMNNALKGADINSDSSRNLFDILSRRYQLSGPSRLGN